MGRLQSPSHAFTCFKNPPHVLTWLKVLTYYIMNYFSTMINMISFSVDEEIMEMGTRELIKFVNSKEKLVKVEQYLDLNRKECKREDPYDRYVRYCNFTGTTPIDDPRNDDEFSNFFDNHLILFSVQISQMNFLKNITSLPHIFP